MKDSTTTTDAAPSILRRLIDVEYLIPARIREGPEETLRKARLAIYFSIALTVQCALWLAIYVSDGYTELAFLLGGGIALLLLVPLVLRYTQLPIGGYLGTMSVVVLGVLSIFEGGLDSSSIFWLSVAPMVTLLLADLSVALVVFGLEVVALAVMATLTIYGIELPPRVDPRNAPITVASGAAMLSATVLTLAFLFERAKQRAMTALETTNHMLADQIRERDRLETELRLAQKLEAVGRLAAGIAHEINTPVQYISDTASFMKDAIHELAAVLERHRGVTVHALASGFDPAMAQNALDHEATADLPYLLDSLPGAIDRICDGLARIAKIVRSMQTFAHLDGATMIAVDLNAQIDNTLIIASGEYGCIADVQRDLGVLPPVTCHAGEINQVVLNLIVNAAHAIEAKVAGTAQRGMIGVTTRVVGDMVELAITDSGDGVSAEIRDRIFDPFFTTKPVGKGTGQGLAIARGVIGKHGGTMSFDSVVGRGSTFRFRIPIHGAAGYAPA